MIEQELFDFCKSHTRSEGRATSVWAARDTWGRVSELKVKILNVLALWGPKTADEVGYLIGYDCHQRVADLCWQDQMIEDSGIMRPSNRGSAMTVWMINEKGRAFLQSLK